VRNPLSILLPILLASQAPAATPLEAYGRLPSIEQATLSPDGSKIALVLTTQDMRLLSIADLIDRKMVSSTRIGDQKVRSVQWADDTHLLLTTGSSVMPWGLTGERQEWRLMQVFDLATRKWRPLMTHANTSVQTMNVVTGRPVVQHKGNQTLLYIEGIAVSSVTHPALFRINLTTGAEDMVREGSRTTKEWLVDDSGDIVAEQGYSETKQRWAISLYSGGHAQQTVAGDAAIDTPDMLGLSATGDEIVCAVREADGYAWKPLAIKDGSWGNRLRLLERMSDLILKDGSNRMIGVKSDGDVVRYRFLDQSLQDGWDWTTRVLGDQRMEFISASADYSKFIVQVMGPKSGYVFLLADLKEHLTMPVGKIYEDVTQIAEVRPIRYQAGDGLEIPAYLTLPPDRPAKNLPVIVMPHGGPQVRYRLGFDWWAQALAAQGYAVLQPNYRGSALSESWVEKGYGEWGRKMQTDLSDGLRYLAAQGIVDANRACIVGGSYGGYAALAGVSIQSGVYRCAVAVAPVSDPASFMQWVGRLESYDDKIGLRYWERFLGVDKPGDKGLDAISPLKNADRITVPVMLIHGRDDTTVPYDQSADLAKALKRAGKPVQFVTLDKEDHYLSRSATRLQMLQSSVEFLTKYNPPD
jgi:dipeptidyl aminopeptidase/acylaminoacyl peptidase